MTMLKVEPVAASRSEQAALTRRTRLVGNAPDYPGRVVMAREQWRLLKPSKWLKTLRGKLADSCSGLERCMYCEDSRADEIEHRRPKKLYPDDAFSWANWLYACGECNGVHVKGDRFAVIIQNRCVEVSRSDGGPVAPPQAGLDALLDLRGEDPMDFIWLNLESGYFTPDCDDRQSERYLRAEWTITHLCLNSRSRLLRARRNAYVMFSTLLRDYVEQRSAVTDAQVAQRKRTEISRVLKEASHRTVWEEMKRQRAMHQELQALFAAAPETLDW